MSAMENNEQRRRRSEPRPYAVGGVSMRDLLASCAAAEAVSRPPRAPEPADPRTVEEHRRAA
ncbi:hypothetical protein C1I97_21190 [Streptomyces sp. NTH33]|uniref:hypothetical protein n=1 Tax=Streptomyces sp. NTH33 TaxID=1735453 RepID=UPI000DA9B6DE|nr:hypothetical protein [Streptomyces sp. NTH33]PZH02437.1 hypothetical protein C1I97_21190 [Streptomyces sp. NTH33]